MILSDRAGLCLRVWLSCDFDWQFVTVPLLIVCFQKSKMTTPKTPGFRIKVHKMMGEVIVGTFIFIYSRYITLARLSIM